MQRLAETKYQGRLAKGRLIQVAHKDHTGRILRISKYLLERGAQKPISEMIFDPQGGTTLYMYSETGEDVKQVIRFDPLGPPGRGRRDDREKKIH